LRRKGAKIMKKRIYLLYMFICQFVFGAVSPCYAATSFDIDRVLYNNGTALIYGSVSSEVYGELAGKEVVFAVYDDHGEPVAFSPTSTRTGDEPASMSGGVYCYNLDPISFVPAPGAVSYSVYASIDGSVAGMDMVVPGTGNTLTALSVDGRPGDVSQGLRRIVVSLPEGTPAGEYPVEFTHNGSYVKVNGSPLTSGSPFTFTDSNPADSEWDSVTVAAYAENNSATVYNLVIIPEGPGGPGGESSIDNWKFVRPSDNAMLPYTDNYYLFYKGIESKETIKVKVQQREGSSAAITGEFRVYDRRNPERPIGEKLADCTVEHASGALYYLSVDLGDISSISDHSAPAPGPEPYQFAICILEDGALAGDRPEVPIAIVNPNPKRASFLNLEGSETTDWAADITNYRETDVPLVLHTVGKGKITFDPGLDLTRKETIANLKDIGPYMMESYGRIELDVLEGSAFQNGAWLEMYNLPFIEMPDIIDDSLEHGVIGSATYSEGTLRFRVNGFTTYIAQPRLSVDDPVASTTDSAITINGTVTDPQATVTITVGGVDQGAVSVDPATGAFSKTVNLALGSNAISVDASHEGFGYDLTPVVKTVARTSSGGSGGGGSGGGGNGSAGATDTKTQNAIEVNSDGSVTVETGEPSVDASGTAIVELSENTLKDAFERASAGPDGVKNIQIVIPASDNAASYKPQIPASFLTVGTENETAAEKIEIKTEIADLIVPGNMLSSELAAGGQNVAITVAKADTSGLDPELQSRIGNKPVIELKLDIDGNPVSWNNPNAPVTVSVPYAPTAEELANTEHIVVWYIDGGGNVVAVPTGRYDPATGKVVFQVAHFSKYAVAYVKKSFDDIGSYGWARKQIEVMASKGIINGTSETTYTPAASITRADFTVLLVKALGLSAEVSDNFADVSPSAYYCREVGIAKKLGIAGGRGGNMFDPLAPVARQDMMALAARAAAIAEKNLPAGSDADLDSFLDRSLIAPYAANSVATLVKNGIVTGCNNLVNPLGNATRAEAAVIIHRLYNK